MPIPKLDAKKVLHGTCAAYGELFAVEIAPSKQYRGCYHIATVCLADNFAEETKKPVALSGVAGSVQHYLNQHGLTIDDISWCEIDSPALLSFHDEYSKAQKDG